MMESLDISVGDTISLVAGPKSGPTYKGCAITSARTGIIQIVERNNNELYVQIVSTIGTEYVRLSGEPHVSDLSPNLVEYPYEFRVTKTIEKSGKSA